MLSENTIIIKSKDVYNKIDYFLNKNWVIFFITVVLLFFISLGHHIFNYIQNDNYMHLHTEIFVMSFICFGTIFFMRPSVLWFLIPFLLTKEFDFYHCLEGFQNYFFNKSIFAELFKNLASKDINVILISFFVVYGLSLFIFLMVYKIINKKWHLKASFLFITIFVYILTTFLFHYFLIEKNYKTLINLELSHMEKISQAPSSDFIIICKNQEYFCANNKNDAEKIINNEKFNEYLDKVVKNSYLRGNFPIGDLHNIYLITQYDNQWVINKDVAKKAFHDTESFLMICLDIAHSFWLFFFIWLNVFHFRKKQI